MRRSAVLRCGSARPGVPGGAGLIRAAPPPGATGPGWRHAENRSAQEVAGDGHGLAGRGGLDHGGGGAGLLRGGCGRVRIARAEGAAGTGDAGGIRDRRALPDVPRARAGGLRARSANAAPGTAGMGRRAVRRRDPAVFRQPLPAGGDRRSRDRRRHTVRRNRLARRLAGVRLGRVARARRLLRQAGGHAPPRRPFLAMRRRRQASRAGEESD